MALFIGGDSDIYKVSQKHFKKFAEDIGVKYNIIKEELQNACSSLPDLIEAESRSMRELGMQFSKEKELIKLVVKQAQRIKRL